MELPSSQSYSFGAFHKNIPEQGYWHCCIFCHMGFLWITQAFSHNQANNKYQAGIAAVFMIFIALVFRSIGVLICLPGTNLNRKEKLFCIIAYLPKATVQAAIGSVPLAMGLDCGQIVLSVAVLAILITAPIGALGMDFTYKNLLYKDIKEKAIGS